MPANYMIVEDTDVNDFQRRIDNYLSQGWSLHGSLSTTSVKMAKSAATGELAPSNDGEERLHYAQAIVK